MRSWIVIGLGITFVVAVSIYVQRDHGDGDDSAAPEAESLAAPEAAPPIRFQMQSDGSIAVVTESGEGDEGAAAGSVVAPEPETAQLTVDGGEQISADERQRRRDAGNARIGAMVSDPSEPALAQPPDSPVGARAPEAALPGIPEEDFVSGIDPAGTPGVLPGEGIEIEDGLGPLPGEGTPQVPGPLPGEGEPPEIGPLPGD